MLALEGIACRRGGRMLFDGLDLRLAAGEAALVTGPNGIGKTSLLRLAAGLLAPAAGSVRRRGRVALAAEAAALDEDRPLAAALHFWVRLDGRDAGAVAAALAEMELAHLAAVPVRLLSTGQRRRAAMARVIAGDAAIWLLDEPASGLDATALERLAAAIRAHLGRGGIVLAASHQPLGVPMRTVSL